MAEKEFIEREAAIASMTADKLLSNFDSVEDAIEYRFHRAAERVLAGLPTADVVEVVRCRECVYRVINFLDIPVCTGVMAYINTPDDWYCACGKRKEENHG